MLEVGVSFVALVLGATMVMVLVMVARAAGGDEVRVARALFALNVISVVLLIAMLLMAM